MKTKVNEAKPAFTKVSMNLNRRTLDNIDKLCEITGESNKTRVVAIALELAKRIMEMNSNGERIIVKGEEAERELAILC